MRDCSSAPRIVCVLGTGRSGTSLITRILNLLGVYLGPPDGFVRAAPANPRGYWEQSRMIELNDAILATFGGTWNNPPALQPGWERSRRLNPIREEARDYIDRHFVDVPLWGWKDPRTCHTLPFWRSILPPLRYVLALRNPLDVAASLKRANNLTFAQSMVYWQTSVTAALQASGGQPRLILFYEDIMQDSHNALVSLARLIGSEVAANNPAVRDAVSQFIDASLHRNHTSLAEQLDHPRVPFTVNALYLTLRTFVQMPPNGAHSTDSPFEAALDTFGQQCLETQCNIDSLLERYSRMCA